MSARPTILTLPIGRTLWSFGYQWHSAQSAQTLKEDALARAAAPDINADVIVLNPDSAQFGLGRLAPTDNKRGMAGAVALSKDFSRQSVRSAICLFPLGSDWWVLSVRGDAISLYGDQVFGDLDSAIDAFIAAANRFEEWGRYYLPAILAQDSGTVLTATPEIAGGIRQLAPLVRLAKDANKLSTAPLEQFLAGQKAPTHRMRRLRGYDMRVVALSRSAKALYATAACALVIFALILPGIHRYQAHRAAQRAEIERAERAAAEAARLAAEKVSKSVFVDTNTPPPSADALSPAGFISICLREMAMIYDRAPKGWRLDKLDCSKTAATAKFSRQFGAIDDISALYGPDSAHFSQDFTSVDIGLPHDSPAAQNDRPLLSVEMLRRQLISSGWKVGESVTATGFAAPHDRTAADQATWQSGTFTITTHLRPTSWLMVLQSMPGLILDHMSVNVAELAATGPAPIWTIEGTGYAD